MPEKLTLAVYLERRGAVKALTRIEAEVFGVPYPLVKGWAHRHGAGEITQTMLDQLQEKIGRARSSTAEKAQRGLNGIDDLLAQMRGMSSALPTSKTRSIYGERASAITGFVLRRPRRAWAVKPIKQ